MSPSIDWTAVDLSNYVKDAQPYIKSVIEDPRCVPSRLMNDVAKTIVNRAWEDPGYYPTAAAICRLVVNNEREQQSELCIPKYTFRTCLVERCQLLLQDWRAMRDERMQYWMCYCRFMGDVYLKIRVDGTPILAFGSILLKILMYLASEKCVQNFEEVDLLCSLFHDCAQDLKKHSSSGMESLMVIVRDAYLSAHTDLATQGLLLPLIELYASNFNLTQDAKRFYFQM